MIERTLRDLNFADYKLVKYEDGRIFIDYKDKTTYRITFKDKEFSLEKLTDGIELIALKEFEEPTDEELLNWVLTELEVRPDLADVDWTEDGCIILKEFSLQKTKKGFRLSYGKPDEDLVYSIESSSLKSLVEAVENTMKDN